MLERCKRRFRIGRLRGSFSGRVSTKVSSNKGAAAKRRGAEQAAQDEVASVEKSDEGRVEVKRRREGGLARPGCP